MKESALVIGATGLVGGALVGAFEGVGVPVAAATSLRHGGGHFVRLDIADEAAVRELLERTRPGVVAVPAANPHVDYCEAHPEETRRVNVEGTLNVARVCRAFEARMIFFSSDYVFDGLNGPYREEDPRCPVNEYGRQKAQAEAEVLKMDPRNLVIRTSGAYGWQWEPKNFVLQILGRLGAGQTMKVAGDVSYNPTYAGNLAEVAAGLAAAGQAGLFHVVGADILPRHEFARLAARIFGLDEGLIEPVASAAFPPSAAPRPKATSLRTEKVRALGLPPLLTAREGLEKMLSAREEWRRRSEERFPPR